MDIGGTHITAGLVNLTYNRLDEGSVVRKAVNAQGNVDQIIKEWASCIADVAGFQEHSGSIGIAMPGPINYEEGVSLIKDQGKYDALYKTNVKEPLADELGLGLENILLLNDAACFLKGEALAGAARGAGRAVGITLGTGLGSSYYMDGRAGDANLWNTPYKDGIVEDYLSTRWFLAEYEQRTGIKIDGVKEMIRPENYDGHVRSLFVEFADNLSSFLTMFVKREKAQAVVIGGNIAKAHSFYLSIVQSNLQAAGVDVSIYISDLGEHAALIGAAYTWHGQTI